MTRLLLATALILALLAPAGAGTVLRGDGQKMRVEDTAGSNYLEVTASDIIRNGASILAGFSDAFPNGGNAGGADRSMGNTDAYALSLLTNNVARLVISAAGTVNFTSNPTVSSNTIWHAGNDGASSGLDADLLDGNHASAFSLTSHDHTGVYLPLAGKAADSSLLNGAADATAGTPSTIAKRDASGDLTSRIFYASVANGTAPFIVNSSTKVASLHADLLDGYEGGDFLPKAGGTMTGDLAMGALNAGRVITFRSDMIQTTTTGLGAEDVQGNGNADGLALYSGDGLIVRTAKGGTEMMKLTAGLVLTVGGSTVWTAGNDGTGSGLDADTVDGNQASAFSLTSHTHDSTYLKTDSSNAPTALNLYSGSLSGSQKWGIETYGGYLMAYGRDSAGYGALSITSHSGNANASSGEMIFQQYNGSAWTIMGYFNKSRNYSLAASNVAGTIYRLAVDNAGGATYGMLLRSSDQTAGVSSGAYIFSQATHASATSSGVLAHLDQGGSSTWAIKATNINDGAATADFTIDTRGQANAFVVPNTGSLTHAGNTIWDAGNDGSSSGLDADLLDGLSVAYSNTPSTVVGRTADGYIYAQYYHQASGDETQAASHYFFMSNTDGWHRRKPLANVKAEIVTNASTNTALAAGGISYTSASTQNIIVSTGRTRDYSGSVFEVRTTDSSPAGISFHTAGVSATSLFELSGQLYLRLWGSSTDNVMWNAGNDGSGTGLDADLLDGNHASAFLGATAKAADSSLLNGAVEATAGTASTIAKRDASGDLTSRVFYASVANGTAPFIVNSSTKVTNLNAEMTDGFHASQSAGSANSLVTTNASGYILANYINSNIGQDNVAASSYIYETGSDGYLRKKSLANVKTEIVTNAAVTTALGYSVGNASGNIPISNGTLNSNLNADMIDGYHAADIGGQGINRGQCYDFADRAIKFVSTTNSIGLVVFDDATHPNLYFYGSTYGAAYDLISYSSLGMTCSVVGTPTRSSQGSNVAVTMGGSGSDVGYNYSGTTNYFSLTSAAEQHVTFLATPGTAGFVYSVFDWNNSKRAAYITFNTSGLSVLLWDEATDGYKSWASSTTFTSGTWYLVDVKLTNITSAGSAGVTASYSTGWSSALSSSAVSFNTPTTSGTFNNVSTSLNTWPSAIGRCTSGSSDSFNGKIGFVMLSYAADMSTTRQHLLYNALVRNFYAL